MSDPPEQTTKTIKLPGPDHPIAVEPNPARIVVSLRATVLADSRNAVTLREAGYPPVHYIPLDDVDMALLDRSARVTYCPYKGDCAYFSIRSGGESVADAAWTYEAPYPAVDAIRGHLAFYPDKVDAIEQRS